MSIVIKNEKYSQYYWKMKSTLSIRILRFVNFFKLMIQVYNVHYTFCISLTLNRRLKANKYRLLNGESVVCDIQSRRDEGETVCISHRICSRLMVLKYMEFFRIY